MEGGQSPPFFVLLRFENQSADRQYFMFSVRPWGAEAVNAPRPYGQSVRLCHCASHKRDLCFNLHFRVSRPDFPFNNPPLF